MTKCKHPCINCKYGYVTDVRVEKLYYNALTDRMDSVFIDEARPACGFNPGGVILDGDNPPCANYENNGRCV